MMRARASAIEALDWRRAVAKGQKKSNKEVRKPKAEKAKPVPAGSNFLTPPKK